jgi:TonB family protein
MSRLISALLGFGLVVWAARADDAPSKPVFGAVDIPKDECLISSFSVFTKLTIARGTCDKLPVAFFQPLPVYPSGMLRAAVVGDATVSFVISAAGTVEAIKVERANIEDLGPAAAGAVAQWRFFPAEKKKVPVSVRVQASFTFSMFDEDGG